MKLYRYCSRAEFYALMRGEKLHNETKHINGEGFFFFPVLFLDTKEIQHDLKNLYGIVTPEVLMICNARRELFTPTQGRYLGYGYYRLPVSTALIEDAPVIMRQEYYTTDYSLDTVRVSKAYAIDEAKFFIGLIQEAFTELSLKRVDKKRGLLLH